MAEKRNLRSYKVIGYIEWLIRNITDFFLTSFPLSSNDDSEWYFTLIKKNNQHASCTRIAHRRAHNLFSLCEYNFKRMHVGTNTSK